MRTDASRALLDSQPPESTPRHALEASSHGASSHGASRNEAHPTGPQSTGPANPMGSQSPILVFDGGCPFCNHFAAVSALRSGIPGLQIRDGRAETDLRRSLAARGYPLRDGAIVIAGAQIWHGAEAISWLCAQMHPDASLLQLLAPLFADRRRAGWLYPGLLLARRLLLAWRGLSPDPDADATHPASARSSQA